MFAKLVINTRTGNWKASYSMSHTSKIGFQSGVFIKKNKTANTTTATESKEKPATVNTCTLINKKTVDHFFSSSNSTFNWTKAAEQCKLTGMD